MIQELFTYVLIPFLTALTTWFFTRKKNKLELSATQTDNQIKASKYYQGLLDDMSKRLDKAIDELMKSEDRNAELMESNRALTKSNIELMAINRELITELQKFKQLNGKNGK
jgi:lipopolysaccharide biosynthesis regulator YciM